MGGASTVRYRSDASRSTITFKRLRISIGYDPPSSFKSGGAADGRGEQIGIHAARLRFGLMNDSTIDQFCEGHIHGLHPVSLAGLHDARNLVELRFSNEVAHGGRGDHDLQCGGAPARFFLE